MTPARLSPYRSIFIYLLTLLLFSGCVQHSSNTVTASKNDILRVGISTNAPPLVYKAGNKLQGLEIDFAIQLGNYLGKEVTFLELPWKDQIPSLEEGKIDIIMSGMTITKKRSYRVSFAEPYFRSGQILLVRSNQARKYSTGIYSIMGNSPAIAVIENTIGDYFITKTINRPNLFRFKTSKSAVKALIDEKIDVFVHDAPIIVHYAAMEEQNRITPILEMATEEYLAWAVNKSDSTLLQQANAFIKEKRNNGELDTTINKWIPYQ